MDQVKIYEFYDKETGITWTTSHSLPMTEEEWKSVLPGLAFIHHCKPYEEPMPEFNGDQLAQREEKYKARRAEADAFVQGMVAAMIRKRGYEGVPLKMTKEMCYWNPFRDALGQSSWTEEQALAIGGKLVDPWEHYGKDFCASYLVTEALNYLDRTPATEAPRPKDDGKHPLYPKGSHYRSHSFIP